MESQKISLQIPCQLHTNEFIQRVNVEIASSQQLYCLECILSNEDPSVISSKLKTIPDLIDTAASFYAKNKQAIDLNEQVPAEYSELVSHQAEKLEQLSKHIEEEKKKVTSVFETIMKDTLKMITEKKNEYLNSLDQQLFNLRYWYIFFDKQLKKAYPSEEDISFLFPTKEDLVTKLGKITNATQLTAFVRNLKEDLNEQKLGNATEINLERNRKAYIQILSKELVKVEDIKPYYKEGDLDLSGFKTELQNHVSDLLRKMLTLEQPIQDVVSGSTYQSKFAKPEEFEMIKKWMPSGASFNPKLIYQASRDGADGDSFHKHCDGKGNTLTLIKAKFANSSKICTIGGYLDAKWHSNTQYIHSSKSFIFSTTSKAKCTVTTQQYGGYGAPGQGPTFGGGHDIVVYLAGSGNQSYVNPNSYSGTAKLIDGSNNKNNPNAFGGFGGTLTYFEPLEVEVYSL